MGVYLYLVQITLLGHYCTAITRTDMYNNIRFEVLTVVATAQAKSAVQIKQTMVYPFNRILCSQKKK